jgi:hypothetical protein
MYLVEALALTSLVTVALFACLIIRTFQLVFSIGTVFFCHNKSANITFSYGFSVKQAGPIYRQHFLLAIVASYEQNINWHVEYILNQSHMLGFGK